MSGRTKEERFLLQLFNISKCLGDTRTPIDRYEVGRTIGLHDRGVNTISNQLAQANFIKKIGPQDIALTAHGEALVLRLLEE